MPYVAYPCRILITMNRLPPLKKLPDDEALHCALHALIAAGWLFRCSFVELAEDPSALAQIEETRAEIDLAEEIIAEWAELLELRTIMQRR